MPNLCRNGHPKAGPGYCPVCLAAKNKRRYDNPTRQAAVNDAHARWKAANPEKNKASQAAFWAREDVKAWNRERMRRVRAGRKRDPLAAAARLNEKATRVAQEKQYGITRKEAA